MVRRFLSCEAGATAIEYALIAGLLAASIVAGINSVGEGLTATFAWLGGLFVTPPSS